jgi:5-methylcytosine-specific restriction endonuclease McrA
LEQDSTAFVEALEVPTSERLRTRRKAEAARARVELVRVTAELRELVDDLTAAELALRTGDYSQLPLTRRLRSGRRPAALAEEVEAARRRLTEKQEEVERKRMQTEALERDAQEPRRGAGAVTVYRLHSTRHSVTCSAGQYAHLSLLQRTRPVLLTKKRGLHWWWYLDRFWWAERGMGAQELGAIVMTTDLASLRHREAFERARAGHLGREGVSVDDFVPEHVRREVWIRDRGRCVDCDVASGIAFDHILPLAAGGTNAVPNLELRCRSCKARRRDNESRAIVGKARIRVRAQQEWGVALTDVSWPRVS